MHLTDLIRYGADPLSTFRMLTDPGFQESKCALSGSLRHTTQIDRAENDDMKIVTTQVLSTRTMPDFVRSLAGETLTVVEAYRWGSATPEGIRHGHLTVGISGTPVQFSGTTCLRTEAEQTVQEVVGELKAALPLVGRKIEKAVEPAVRAAIHLQERASVEWIATH